MGHRGFLGLGWTGMRSGGGSARSLRLGDGEHHVVSAFWPRGTATPVHEHEGDAWLHVLSGEVIEERWTRAEDGGWVYASLRLRAGDQSSLPPGAVHRLAARRDSSVIIAARRPCTDATAHLDPELHAVIRLSRTDVAHAAAVQGPPSSTSVGVSSPLPEKIEDDDA